MAIPAYSLRSPFRACLLAAGCVLLPLASACSDSEPEQSTCPGGPNGPVEADYSLVVTGDSVTNFIYPPDGSGGTLTVWSPDIRTIVLGPEETGEPLAGLNLEIAQAAYYAGDSCLAEVKWATLSTTQVRVGTSEELDAKLYELVPDACNNGLLNAGFSYVRVASEGSSSIAVHDMCIRMQRVMVTPDNPPSYGEKITVAGVFTALEP